MGRTENRRCDGTTFGACVAVALSLLCGTWGFGVSNAAAEEATGEVSRETVTGYQKAYRYDDRFLTEEPLYFPNRVSDFLFFTNFETLDPGLGGEPLGCAGKYYSEWEGKYECIDLTFGAGSRMEGPFHTNDTANVDGSAEFGRAGADPPDVVEIDGGTYPEDRDGQCTGKPIFRTATQCYVEGERIPLPAGTTDLSPLAEAQDAFSGETRLELDGTTNTIQVVRFAANGTEASETIAWPKNGLIYVRSNSCGWPTANSDVSQNADGPEEARSERGCGDVYVRGTYSLPLTVVAEDDLIIDGNIYPTSVAGHLGAVPTGTATLGLVAGHYVRIYHPLGTGDVNGSSGCVNLAASEDPNGWGAQPDIWIYAAILAVQNSLIVDNWDCGSRLGDLNVYGSVAQNYRGIVGTEAGVGMAGPPPPATRTPAACTSRRDFTVHVVKIPGLVYRRVSLTLNGHLVAIKRRKQITASIDLRGLPKGTYVLRITVETNRGRRIIATRTYHTCAATPARPKRPPEL